MRWLRGIALFIAGSAFGILAGQPSAAPQEKTAGMRLDHFGIYVKDLDKSLDFYTKTMGFREAFRVKDKDGKTTIIGIQMNRDTFLELAPASADHPEGVTHAGLWVEDLNATLASLRERGLKVEDPHVGSTKAIISNIIEPDGVRLELLQLPPDSLWKKAMDTWKQQ